MTQQPFSTAALRGAVDLSAFKQQPGSGASATASGGAPGQGGTPDAGSSGVLVQATDATFEAVVNGTMTVPGVLVLWAAQVPESEQHLQTLATLARSYEGRFRVIGVDLATNPGIVQALTPVLQQSFGEVNGLPVVLGLIQGQPMPLYLGVQEADQLRPLVDKLLELAVSNGMTGRADLTADDGGGSAEGQDDAGEEPAEPELPASHQRAFDAIERGDLTEAAEAYRQALQENPGDEDARLGLGQVQLMARTQDLDPAAVRAAAADRPADVQAQIEAADLEFVGGHVEDAFARMVDTVRRSADEDRNRARQHLLGLFDALGAADDRVAAARRALTNALF